MDKLGDKVDKGLSDKQNIGLLGEETASLFLKKHGFVILDRNYWKVFGEIDIVAKRGGIIHFFEVKTVSRGTLPKEGEDEFLPEENIHPWKIKRLTRTIQTYLLQKKISEDLDWQLDAALVYLEKGTNRVLKIEIIEDILV